MAQGYIRKFTPIIIVAILILIQGILYLAASLWTILVYKCGSIPNTQLGKVMHFIYLRDKACGEISWSTTSSSSDVADTNIFLDDNTFPYNPIIQSPATTAVVPDMPDITLVAFRTHILALVYCIISGLWILTTLMVLGASCCWTAGRKTFNFCFIPWMIFVIIGSILDLIATGFHAHDIYYTTSAEKTLEYLNVKNIAELMNEIKDFSKLFAYPAIIFTCVSCRLIIFWLINILGVLLAFRHAQTILFRKIKAQNSPYEQQVLSTHKDMPYDHHREFSSKEPSIAYSTSSPRSSNIRGGAGQGTGERKTFEPFRPNSSAIIYDNKYLRQDEGFSESRHNFTAGKRKSNDFSRYDDTSPIAYRRYQHGGSHESPASTDHRLSLNSERFNRESSLPPIGYRFSLQHPANSKETRDSSSRGGEKKHGGIENVHITEELRGQLPWSYFSARDDIATPKRALTHVEENDIMPPVPVPDYTYHFPRKERPSIKNNGNESEQFHHSHNNNMTSASPTTSTRPQSPNSRW